MDDAGPATDGHARPQRPQAQRQAPLRRSPLGLSASMGSTVNAALGAALESGAALGAGMGSALRQSMDGSRTMAGAAEAGMQGFVERGVDTAYTVIDAYMRRGQQAAQSQQPFGHPATPHRGATGDGMGAWPQTVTTALGQTASKIAGPWMQLVRAWADGLAALAPPADANSAVRPAGAVAAGPRSKVTIEFLSRQVAQVEVALEPGADLASLHANWSCDGLPATAPGNFVFHSVPGHVHLRLMLAETAAPGRHQAAVADGHGQVWGSMAVTIAPGQFAA